MPQQPNLKPHKATELLPQTSGTVRGSSFFPKTFSPGGIWIISLGNCNKKRLHKQIPTEISWHLKEKGTLTSFEERIEERPHPFSCCWGPREPGAPAWGAPSMGLDGLITLSSSPLQTNGAWLRSRGCTVRTQTAWTRGGPPR